MAQVALPLNISFTGAFFANSVLPKVVDSFLERNNIRVLPHPPYSPDLSPCNFWLFPILREKAAGKSYDSRSALGSALSQWLRDIPVNAYIHAYESWCTRLQLCTNSHGFYFE